MINFFQFPPNLIYVGKGENAYEKYMTDDLTGINHVLDKMYGEVFNLKNSELETDPGFYMDCAYQMAIAIKLQKYPHRFLKFEDIDDNFLYNLSPKETYLVSWMAYALLALRDDNSDELKEFLAVFSRKERLKRQKIAKSSICFEFQVVVAVVGFKWHRRGNAENAD